MFYIVIRGWHIPILPIITGGFMGILVFSSVQGELDQWASFPGIIFFLTFSPWWALPAAAGALFGGAVGKDVVIRIVCIVVGYVRIIINEVVVGYIGIIIRDIDVVVNIVIRDVRGIVHIVICRRRFEG